MLKSSSFGRNDYVHDVYTGKGKHLEFSIKVIAKGKVATGLTQYHYTGSNDPLPTKVTSDNIKQFFWNKTLWLSVDELEKIYESLPEIICLSRCWEEKQLTPLYRL